jgi:uncharacterized membrane protein
LETFTVAVALSPERKLCLFHEPETKVADKSILGGGGGGGTYTGGGGGSYSSYTGGGGGFDTTIVGGGGGFDTTIVGGGGVACAVTDAPLLQPIVMVLPTTVKEAVYPKLLRYDMAVTIATA